MRYGADRLKPVRRRRDDALSRIGWAQLEQLLAAHYRALGWRVDHVGTGAPGAPFGSGAFDGGVDLRLYRDAQAVLVQCKHWNARQVPHNAVHELLGILVNEGATGAILVSSGEFTPAAIAAARRHGHVRLIDGDALRAMLGPWSWPEHDAVPAHAPPLPALPALRGVRPAAASRPVMAPALPWLLAAVMAVLFVLMVRAMLARTADTAGPPPAFVPARAATSLPSTPSPIRDLDPVLIDARPPARRQPPARPTEAQIRRSQQAAAEAMRVIEHDTPEL